MHAHARAHTHTHTAPPPQYVEQDLGSLYNWDPCTSGNVPVASSN